MLKSEGERTVGEPFDDLRMDARNCRVASRRRIGPEKPLRFTDGRQIHRVTVNGKEWRDFDAQKEWIRIPNAGSSAFTIVANY